jgi:hypothetical protein
MIRHPAHYRARLREELTNHCDFATLRTIPQRSGVSKGSKWPMFYKRLTLCFADFDIKIFLSEIFCGQVMGYFSYFRNMFSRSG